MTVTGVRTKCLGVMALFLTVALLMTAGPVLAQTGQGSPQGMMNEGAPAQEFDQPTLEKFAAAATDLRDIRGAYTQKLQGVQDQEKAMDIQREMGEKMVSAVKQKGLNVETYNEIANQLAVDPQLQRRVEALMD